MSESYIGYNVTLNVFTLILLFIMLLVRSAYNGKTAVKVMGVSILMALIFSLIVFYPNPGAIIDGAIRPLGAGLYYLIIVGIISLFKRLKRKNKQKLNG